MWSGFGSALVGGAASLFGTSKASKGQKAANQLQMQLAQKQMDFQERMSSTAHQRAVQDLRSAGLNPILAAGQPASSPGGAMAGIHNPDQAWAEGATDAVTSALAARMQRQQISNLRQDERVRRADEKARLQEADNLAEQKFVIRSQNQVNQALTNMYSEIARNTAWQAQLSESALPSAKAEADLWRRLGEDSSSARGLQRFLPLIRDLRLLLPRGGRN